MKNKIRLLSVLSIVCLGLISLTMVSCDATGGPNHNISNVIEKENYTEGLQYKLYENGECYSVIGIGTATDKEIIIPSTYNGKPIKSIEDEAFLRCSSLVSITIPDSVTSIGWCAFYFCDSLKSVTIGKEVASIGEGAFCGCSSLESIIVDSNNKYYDSKNNCNAIIETLTNKLIVGCKNTIIPYGVTSIGGVAFENCSSLESIKIPDSVTIIEQFAFHDCSSLKSITIPSSVISIGRAAFYRCSSLTSITIPDSVTSIGEYVFSSCSSLTSIEIPNSVTSIGNYAFEYCSSLTSIEIPDSVTSIGNYAFEYCSSLTNVYYTGTEEQWNATTIGYNHEYLTSATITYNYVPEE